MALWLWNFFAHCNGHDVTSCSAVSFFINMNSTHNNTLKILLIQPKGHAVTCQSSTGHTFGNLLSVWHTDTLVCTESCFRQRLNRQKHTRLCQNASFFQRCEKMGCVSDSHHVDQPNPFCSYFIQNLKLFTRLHGSKTTKAITCLCFLTGQINIWTSLIGQLE